MFVGQGRVQVLIQYRCQHPQFEVSFEGVSRHLGVSIFIRSNTHQIQLIAMQNTHPDTLDNEFIQQPRHNPEDDSPTPSKGQKKHEEGLTSKRQIIERELKELMTRVDQYQVEKTLLTNNSRVDEPLTKAMSLKQQKLLRPSRAAESPLLNLDSKLITEKERYEAAIKADDLTGRYESQNLKKGLKVRSISQRSSEDKRFSNRPFLKKSEDKYINYLPDINFKEPLPGKVDNEERKHQKLMGYLDVALQMEKDAVRKISELKRKGVDLNYKDYLAAEKQIDDIYVQSLKSRIQCVMKM